MGQARWGLRDLRLQEGGSPPRQPAQPLVDVDYARQGRGEVTFSLTEGRFSDRRCRHIIAGGAVAAGPTALPVGSPGAGPVNGTFRCTADGAVALTLRQDSHQLSLSGRDSVARWPLSVSRHAPAGMPPLLALLVTRPTANNARARRRGSCRKMVTTGAKMTTLAALSLHFPFVWYGFLLLFGPALGALQCGDLSSAAHVDPDRGRRADNPQHPGSSCPQCRQPISRRDNIPLLSFLWLGRRAAAVRRPSRGAIR